VNPYPLIAVVDDDPSICTSLQRLLRTYGLEAATFTSGQAFMDRVAKDRPSALILDLDMPGMTGFDVQRALRESGAGVPVIVLAARDDAATEARCRAAGAAAFLRKPIDERTLLDTLVSVLRMRAV
jgi:FixJ family two-component response regulator